MWAQTQPNAHNFQNFAGQYVILTVLPGPSPSSGRAGPGQLASACAPAALMVLLADLLFSSYPVTDTSPNPDIRPPREIEWARAISRTTEPLRLSRANHIHPQRRHIRAAPPSS